jgi:hypothetical protein
LKEGETVSRADLVFVGSLVSFGILVFAVLNIAGSMRGAQCGYKLGHKK